jgi:hypothetical protein
VAKGSHTGWFGLPPAQRVCAGCGQKLTLKNSGALWFQEHPVPRRVWHFPCRLNPKEIAEMTEPKDQLAVTRAGIDQMIANLPDLARGYYAYYKSMVETGFTAEQALTLTIEWMKSMLTNEKQNDGN